MSIYLVNYTDDEDIALVVDGKPKNLGPKKTETISGSSGDLTIRISNLATGQTMISVEHKGEVEQHANQT